MICKMSIQAPFLTRYIHAISVIPPLFNTITQGGGGGGGGGRVIHVKKRKEIHSITAKCFSNPHTDFGARRSRRLGVRSATN